MPWSVCWLAVCCRRLAHAKVQKEKRQQAAKDAAEGAKKEVGWLEWLRGGSAAAASGGQQSAIDKLSGPSAGAAAEVRCLQLAAAASSHSANLFSWLPVRPASLQVITVEPALHLAPALVCRRRRLS